MNIRLLKPQERERKETPRQEKALREIVTEHALNKWTPIDKGNDRNPLPTDEILSGSYRKTDRELG